MFNELKQELILRFSEFSLSETIASLMNNDVFLGFLALSLIGTVVYLFRTIVLSLLKSVFMFLLKQMTVEVTFNTRHHDDENAFFMLTYWMNSKSYDKRTRRFKVTYRYHEEESGDGKYDLQLYPNDGAYLFFYKGKPIFIKKSSSSEDAKQYNQSLTLMTFGRSKETFNSILKEIKEIGGIPDDEVGVFSYGSMGSWTELDRKKIRNFDSIILPQYQKDKIKNDLDWFLKNEDWFNRRFIPYKRTYMFHGEPGCGKSTLAFVIAAYLKKNIYTLSLNNIKSDGELLDAFSNCPRNAILLIEDVDTVGVTNSRGKGFSSKINPVLEMDEDDEESPSRSGKSSKSELSLSGLLNVMDGVCSVNGRILVLTTNDPNKLDRALVRKGRVDVDMRIDLPGEDVIGEMFDRFFPDDERKDRFVNKIKDTGKSMADIQGILIEMSYDEKLFENYTRGK